MAPDCSQITERGGEPATFGQIADMFSSLSMGQRVLQAPSTGGALWYRSGAGDSG